MAFREGRAAKAESPFVAISDANCANTGTLVKMGSVSLPQNTVKRVKTWFEKHLWGRQRVP